MEKHPLHQWQLLRLLAPLLLVSTLFFSGCDLYTRLDNVDVTPTPTPDVVVPINKTLQDKISLALKEASRQDCITLYKFFAGLSDFLTDAKVSDLTVNDVINKTFMGVQTRYGWIREKYPTLTDAISDDIVSKKLDEPHNLSDVYENGHSTYRDVLLNCTKEYAAIVKGIAERKNQ